MLDALGVRRLSAPGYEADDLIATLATQAAAEDMDVLIVTGDRDVLQLVSDRVTALMTRRGISDMTRFTPETVAEKYGLTPAQYPDFAALRGDPSDNLPGIPGVGEKTATKWIAEFGSLAALVDRVDEVKGKAGDALREHLAGVLRNRQLTALVTDLPAETVGAVPGDLLPVAWDRDKIHQLFDSLEFKVLRERLYQTLPHGLIGATGSDPDDPLATAAAGRPEKASFEVVTDLLGPDQVSAWLAARESAERSGLTLAGTWGRGTGNVTAMAIAAPDGHGAHLDPAQLTEADERALAAWLADPGHPKVLHDAKGPMHALVARGLPLAGLACDTALAAYLALPGQRTFDLARGGRRRPADAGRLGRARRGGRPGAAGPGHARAGRGAGRGPGPARVGGAAAGARAAADRRAGQDGAHRDRRRLRALRGHVVHAARRGQGGRAGRVRGRRARVQPGLAQAAAGAAVQRAQLAQDQADQDRVHHRLRGADQPARPDRPPGARAPAAAPRREQDIPIRSELGRQIRLGFVVGKGYECLLSADYSQIELRIMAHLSEDEALIAAFESGHDFHAATASRVFGIPPGEVGPELRAKIKAMNYGLAYGLSAFGLANQLRITPDEARGLMEEYFSEFGGVRDYLHEVVSRARTDGYTATMMGRRRYLPDLVSDNRQRREMAERMALNAPIQGSAADVIKVAMLAVDAALAPMRSRMLLQVHDELIIEVAPGEFDAVRDMVCAAMAGAASLRVPLDVSVGTGRSWAEAAH